MAVSPEGMLDNRVNILAKGIGKQLLEPCWGCDGPTQLIFHETTRSLGGNRIIRAFVSAIACARRDDARIGDFCRELAFPVGTHDEVNRSISRVRMS